jgi:hypothetical protein
MYVAVHHTITDAQKWEQVTKNLMTMVEKGQLPHGLKGLMYLPGTDGHRADCFWEAQSVDALRNFLNPAIGTAARNDYFEINAQAAFGLPGQEAMRQAA